jgi:hypothetical protein
MPLLSVTIQDREIFVKLTTIQAAVLTMRRYERKPIKQIAAERGTDHRTVRRILARASERFTAAGITLPPVPVMRQRTVRPFSLSTQFSY